MRKPAKTKPPKTPLQALFMARLEEELQKRSLNPNQLGKRGKTLKIGNVQRQAQDILNGISDPRLETIYKICRALEKIEPWELLQHSDGTRNNVIVLPDPERVMGALGDGYKTRLKRNKRR